MDINKGISDITKVIDDSFESNDEAAQKRSKRHELDTTSPFKLPHLIRPISFIWAMVNETILTWATIFVVFFVKDVDPNASTALMAALAANTTILTAIVSFYYNRRTAEKNTAKKVAATIKLEEIKIKETIRKEKVIDRRDRRQENQDKRDKRREKRND